MGADDANEGHGPGECVEHAWELAGMDAGLDGTVLEKRCSRCGSVAVVTPAELRGEV